VSVAWMELRHFLEIDTNSWGRCGGDVCWNGNYVVLKGRVWVGLGWLCTVIVKLRFQCTKYSAVLRFVLTVLYYSE